MRNDPNKSDPTLPVCEGCGTGDASCRRSVMWGNRDWCVFCFNLWYGEGIVDPVELKDTSLAKRKRKAGVCDGR